MNGKPCHLIPLLAVALLVAVNAAPVLAATFDGQTATIVGTAGADALVGTSGTNWVEALAVPIDWDQVNARVDWSITNNTRIMIRHTGDGCDNAGPIPGGASVLWGDDPFPALDAAWEQPSDSLVAQLNQVIGTAAVNTVTYSQSGNDIIISANPGQRKESGR